MAAISVPSSSSFPTASSSARSRPTSAAPPAPLSLFSTTPRCLSLRFSVSSRLFSSNPSSSSGPDGSISDPNPSSSSSSSSSTSGGGGELQYGLPPPARSGSGAPVFVTLPVDAVAPNGRMTRKKTMGASFLALALVGVEGVTVECWWGIVEREAPGVYDWGGYLDLVTMAQRYGLKVRAIMAFHKWGTGPEKSRWIPLPSWVLEEMDKEQDLAYSDRFGRRNREYISLGCDILPVLKGRTPIQAYSDFMRSFRDTFKDFLGVSVTEIQVGMGPAGELRYPFCPTEKLMGGSTVPELGEFQCYDKYMLASLSACGRSIGRQEWGYGSPLGASNLLQNPEETTFFRSDGSWSTPYVRFFLEWYSGMLLLHGERLCMITDAIFCGTSVTISTKVAGIHWHYETNLHQSELTAGYYNTIMRNGYLPIAHMFARYRMTLCCTCFDMQDSESRSNLNSSPDTEGFLGRLVYAARRCNLPLTGEISAMRLDDTSLNRVINSSRLYFANAYSTPLSFNYIRMSKSLFDSQNWTRFSKFVKRMSDIRTFQARLDLRGSESCFSYTSVFEEAGRALVSH